MINRWILIAVMAGSGWMFAAGVVMPEGFVLDGVEGLARHSEPNGWSFIPDTDLVYMKTTLPAGNALPILPSGGLEQIRSLAREQQKTRIKIWGILTLYKKSNFIFPIQLIALSENSTAPSQPLPAKPVDPNTMDPSVSEVIPSEVMKILRSQSRIDLARMSEVMDSGSGDFSLIGKTGLISFDTENLFVPDSFGRKVEHGRLPLLSCLTLEEIEKQQDKGPGRRRYSISGIVTSFDGKQYLLLYRAVRTYSHGNFTP